MLPIFALARLPRTHSGARLVTAGIARQLRLEMQPPDQIEFRFDRIPRGLRAIPQWVAWRYVVRRRSPPAADGWSKMPIDPASGRAAKSNDRSTWGAFDAALAYYSAHGDDADPYTVAHGIGLMLSSELGLAGGDIDHCVERGGVLSPFAQHVLLMLGSTYVEASPSGRGIRFFAYGRRPAASRDRNDDLGLEVYDGLRFLTVTGGVLPGFETIEHRQAAVTAICNGFLSGAPDSAQIRGIAAGQGPLGGGSQISHIHGVCGGGRVETPRAPVGEAANHGEFDDDLRRTAQATAKDALGTFAGRPGKRRLLSDAQIEQALLETAKAAKLWAGDWSGYASQSHADAALVTCLGVLTGMDAPRTYRLFMGSGLYREKWHSPRQDQDYGAYTIAKVFAWMRSPRFIPRQRRKRPRGRPLSRMTRTALEIIINEPAIQPAALAGKMGITRARAKTLLRRIRPRLPEYQELAAAMAATGGERPRPAEPSHEPAGTPGVRVLAAPELPVQVHRTCTFEAFWEAVRSAEWRPGRKSMESAFTLITRFADQEHYALTTEELAGWFGALVRWRDTVRAVAATPEEASRALRRGTALWVEYAVEKVEAALGRPSNVNHMVSTLARYYREQKKFMHRNALVRLSLDLRDWHRRETGADLKVWALARCLQRMLSWTARPVRTTILERHLRDQLRRPKRRKQSTAGTPGSGWGSAAA